jgi:hypothetical protein
MTDGMSIVIRNNLISEKRDLNVYHHSTRSAYIVSHKNEVSIRLEKFAKGDFLDLSIVRGPGSMENECWMRVPSGCVFSIRNMSDSDTVYTDECIWVRFPPGPPLWQLKLAQPLNNNITDKKEYIIIGDLEHKPDEGLGGIAFERIMGFVERTQR